MTLVLSQPKCCLRCVDGILYRRCVHVQRKDGWCDHENFVSAGEFFTPGKISIWREQRWPTEELRDVTPLWAPALSQTSPGWEIEKRLICIRLGKPEKRGESKIIRCLKMVQCRLVKVKKRVEMKMIRCLNMVLYNIHESCEAGRN